MTMAHKVILAAGLFLAAAGGAVQAQTMISAPPDAPVAAAAPAAATAPAKPAKPDPEDKIICKTEVPTGSRLGGKTTCMKRREWEQMAADARDQQNHANPH